MADNDDDVSVTSTVLSEQESEYEVETILTEQVLGDNKTYYLVKWAGYPIARCTWEPVESFYNKETFADWDRKKKEIAAGERRPFDLEGWERHLTALEKAREQRKRRREAKRKRLGVSVVQAAAAKENKRAAAAAASSSSSTSPKPSAPAGGPGPVNLPPKPPVVMYGSSQNRRGPWMASCQKRPADGGAVPKPYTLSARRRLDLVKPSNWPPRAGNHVSMSTPKLGNHVVSSPTEGSPASPQVPDRRQSDTCGAGPLESRVSWGPDRQPEVDTWRPGPLESRVSREFDNSPPRVDRRPEPLEARISSVPDRRQEADTWRPEPLESRMSWESNRSPQQMDRRPEPLESRISSGPNKRPPLADTLRPEPLQSRASLRSDRPLRGDFPHPEPPFRNVTVNSWRPNYQPTSPESRLPSRRTTSPTLGQRVGPERPADQPFGIRNVEIPPLPSRRLIDIKGSSDRRPKDGDSQYRFWNAGEVYAHMYFGPDKTYTGPMRLCGLKKTTIDRIMQSKLDNRVDIWFQEIYSPHEYRHLCGRSSFNTTHDNGWIEGYNDTEPNIYKTGELLRRGPYMAVSYPRPNTPRNVIIAYSPFSPEFSYLNKGPGPSSQTFLHLNLRNPMSRPEKSSVFAKISQSQIPVHVEQPEQSERPNTPKPHDSLGQSASAVSEKPAIDAKDKQDAQEIKDTKDKQDKHPHELGDSIITESHESPVLQESQKQPQSAKTFEQPSEQPSGQPLDRNNEEDIDMPTFTEVSATNEISVEDFDVNNFFRDVFKMPFDTLSSINGSRGNIKIFYLMCPEEDTTVQAEREVLVEFLKKNESVIFSNRLEEDWDRFVRTLNQGVVLFHESFFNYDEMSNLQALIKKQFTFWSFSLTGFGSGDDKTHFQRLFPHGGVILMTEDFMLCEPDATVIILAWFNDWTKRRFPGMWKIMFRPNVLDWLLQQNEPKEDARKGIWLAMYSLIIQLGSNNDLDSILSDGIHDVHSDSRAISPQQIPLYGSRTDDDYLGLNLPRGLDQQARNADHLAEFFAGWALVNSHRYRRFTVLTTVNPLERWNHWNHVEFFTSTIKFFENSNIDYKYYWQKLRSNVKKSSAMSEERKAELSSNSVSSPKLATPASRA